MTHESALDPRQEPTALRPVPGEGHPVSNPVGKEGYFPGGIAAGLKLTVHLHLVS
jgi:hypothetical protein